MLALFSSLLPGCSPSWKPAFDEKIAEGLRGRVAIAPLAEALTLARRGSVNGSRIVAVTAFKDDVVEAVDLSASLASSAPDATALFVEQGYDKLEQAIAAAPQRLSFPASELLLPVDFDDRHIAAGTNYPEHAKDAGTTRPFLFPKRVQPTKSGDAVSERGGLLDYEVELAVLPLERLGDGASPRWLGLMVSNDFTDRETLMKHIDRGDVESGKGFTTGKSFPGYLAVGPLLVIPRDWRAFVPKLELRLYVNGQLRQRSQASEMVWDIDEILRQVHARKAVRWEHRGSEVALYDGDAIAPRTLILTGTPHGTVFDGVPTPVIVSGLLRWIAGGSSKGIPGQVIEAYAREARSARAYLQPGDEVLTRIEGIGEIRSPVVP